MATLQYAELYTLQYAELYTAQSEFQIPIPTVWYKIGTGIVICIYVNVNKPLV